jgi:predicted phosphodiesterase
VGRSKAVEYARGFKPASVIYSKIIEDSLSRKITKPPKPTGKPRRLSIAGSDIHGHKRDPVAWSIFLQAIRDLQPDGVFLMGDITDGQSVNRHTPAPSDAPVTIRQEFGEISTIFDEVDAVATKAWERYVITGNHDACRFDKWMLTSCPSALRDSVPSIWDAARVRERGYRLIDSDEQPFRVGNLLLLHGHFYNKHHPHSHLMALGESCLYGHTHTPGQATTNMAGRKIQATGMPCLRTLTREWEHQSKVHTWTNGFAVIEWVDGVKAFPRNVYIVDGVAVYGGHVWRG